MAHILCDFCQIIGFHDLATLAENHFPLIIHHIIEFQKLFADVKVATFHFGLRAF